MLESAADRLVMLTSFGESAVWKRSTTTLGTPLVIVEVSYQDTGASVQRFVGTVTTVSVSGIKLRDTITVGSIVYRVVDVQDDETGITNLLMEKV